MAANEDPWCLGACRNRPVLLHGIVRETHLGVILEAVLCECWSCSVRTLEGGAGLMRCRNHSSQIAYRRLEYWSLAVYIETQTQVFTVGIFLTYHSEKSSRCY